MEAVVTGVMVVVEEEEEEEAEAVKMGLQL